ncbi:regulation of nuclear pre-mRNA domain-containing protein 1B [Sitodiplosis mosellana]|uniref:regulation of nuclear pre-mRNA domain-containing protein 1B n=1 Tax=Sitodiplosis mosellana TaxID=263140 RepID=UPI0024438A6F|nr:regulation of nuclear pre-mRNA domain-containing protein 1B [Sitodiplosis mosellana]XP_055309372.1 regulation of nuclear pre-mRNA domain-containing protein 1B [Sitodiplosis mosellana]XP_055309373.1 regulation of nuclear pre-mRNA domain-containing protein 1B [Sitodiplosis mosellana]XP_055309374.1 regulation of nuclear pre-mRNA domain-containing protein 1B [Sitodiplosis mosellana]
MSAFTETALIKKLMELNASQQSIQTLSLWLIHHRKHMVFIVKSWYKELMKVPQSKKLTYMYLANDVIQNSKKKGPEYGLEFGKILKNAFTHIGDTCSSDDKTLGSLGRILKIWEDRGVYEEKLIEDFRNALNHLVDKAKNSSASTTSKRKSTDAVENGQRESSKKQKTSGGGGGGGGGGKEHGKRETIEINGTVETHVILSPKIPAGDPPEPEELIKALLSLENSASSDANIRERIANLPPEVSEIALLSKLEDKEAAAKLIVQVNEAAQILHDYNTRLSVEMEERKKLTQMLKDFQAEQKELLAQAEQRLEEYNKKLVKVKDVQKEIKNHLNNLPDLTQLPDVTGGLAPLPSAGDLFNVHSG